MRTKYAVLTAPWHVELREKDVQIGDDEVLIKVACCGLCNWEIGFFKGTLNAEPFGGYPMTLGHEYCGTVVETGKAVTTLKVGDKVSPMPTGLGAFAEYYAAPAYACLKLDDGADMENGISEPLRGIVVTVKAAKPEAGDYGVVLGCGPMGLWCTQLLAGNLLAGLIVVDRNDAKLKLAEKYGATHCINPEKTDAFEEIRRITNGRMADFVIEGTGNPKMLYEAARYAKDGRGRIAVMSYYSSPVKDLDYSIFSDKGLILTNPHNRYSEDLLEDTRRAVELLNRGSFKVKELITHRYRLEDIQTAMEEFARREKPFMKAIVVP